MIIQNADQINFQVAELEDLNLMEKNYENKTIPK